MCQLVKRQSSRSAPYGASLIVWCISKECRAAFNCHLCSNSILQKPEVGFSAIHATAYVGFRGFQGIFSYMYNKIEDHYSLSCLLHLGSLDDIWKWAFYFSSERGRCEWKALKMPLHRVVSHHWLVEQSVLKYQEYKSGCSDFLWVRHLPQLNKTPKPNMSKRRKFSHFSFKLSLFNLWFV